MMRKWQQHTLRLISFHVCFRGIFLITDIQLMPERMEFEAVTSAAQLV